MIKIWTYFEYSQMLKCCTAAVARYPTKLLAASRKKRCLLVRKFCFFTRFCGRLFSPLWGGNLKSTRHVVRAATRRAQGHWQIVFSEGSIWDHQLRTQRNHVQCSCMHSASQNLTRFGKGSGGHWPEPSALWLASAPWAQRPAPRDSPGRQDTSGCHQPDFFAQAWSKD